MIIYKITNTNTNKIYIGQTITTKERRLRLHFQKSRTGNSNSHLHNSMRKHGEEAFVIEVIDTATSLEELNEKEKYWIAKYDAVNTGYNILPDVYTNPMHGKGVAEKHAEVMRSEEVRDKISNTMREYRRKNPVSEETRKKLGEKSRRAHVEGRMPVPVMKREYIELATLAKQKKVSVMVDGQELQFGSIKESCEWLLENTFKNKYNFKYLQNYATKSNKTGVDLDGVTWKYL